MNADERIRRAELRVPVSEASDDTFEATVLTDIEVLTAATRMITQATGVVGIGSPRASLESNFALRCLVGPHSFFAGFGEGERRLVDRALEVVRDGPAPVATLKQIEESDAVLVLGEDVLNTAPRGGAGAAPVGAAAADGDRRHAEGAPLGRRRRAAGHDRTKGTALPGHGGRDGDRRHRERGLPWGARRHRSSGLRRGGGAGPPLASLQLPLPDEGRPLDGTPSAVRDLARRVAASLLAAERPLVVAGTSLGSEALLRAAADIAGPCGQRARRRACTSPYPSATVWASPFWVAATWRMPSRN